MFCEESLGDQDFCNMAGNIRPLQNQNMIKKSKHRDFIVCPRSKI